MVNDAVADPGSRLIAGEAAPAIVQGVIAPPRITPVRTTASGDSATAPIAPTWLGAVPYREAWDLQRRLAAARADALVPDQLLLLEHPAVLTLGRHADEAHVRATGDELERRGIEVIRVERGGEVTYHGPGQLVAYPIIALAERGLLIRPFVRALEAAMRDTCAALGVHADRREGHPGLWCDPVGPQPRKIGALGIRIERGVSYHGIAFNIAPDLGDFELIDACGMPGVASTSIARELGHPDDRPTAEGVARAAQVFAAAFIDRIGAPPITVRESTAKTLIAEVA
jgi:lipoyl(octanoyl) transferase